MRALPAGEPPPAPQQHAQGRDATTPRVVALRPPDGRESLPARPGKTLPDSLSRAAAKRLSGLILRYWAERGFRTVRCAQERLHLAADGEIRWVVRSNLIGGLPPT